MRSVLITGTSSGIGLSAAVELAKRGWLVFATMRDVAKASPLEAAARAAGVQDKVKVVRLDVADKTSIEAAVPSVLAATGGVLDAVVHNAGVSVAGAFEDLPEAGLRRVMETNVFGVLALTRALLPVFRAQRRGRIVIVSSEAAFFGLPANGIYSASKWAIEGWAESLTYDVEPFGIDVVIVEPGPHRTAIWETTPRIRPADSHYRALVQQVFRAGDAHAASMARDPSKVARAIARALEASRPRFRYPVGPFATLHHVLRGKVPSRFVRWITRRYLGLDRAKV